MKKTSLSTDFSIVSKKPVTFMVDKNIDQIRNIIDNILPEKLNSCKFEYDATNGIFQSKTGVSIYSWGETIKITLINVDEFKIQLSISSKPRLATTIFDYGKNAMNIQKIKLAIEYMV